MYLVMRGTTVQVDKPDGRRITMKTRKNLVFSPQQSQLVGYNFWFKQDGYTMIVSANNVQNAWAMCPDCRKMF